MKPDIAAVRRVLDGASVANECADERLGVVCRLGATDVALALGALRSEGYESLVDLFASDTGEALEVTYHLRSFVADTEVYMRATVPYDGALPSVWETHPAALYAEREAAELFGLTFEGHPNLERLLTSDHVPGFLMRKASPVRTHEEVIRDV